MLTTLSDQLPDWMPWWAAFAIAVPVILYALVFLLMPFSVIGLKGRLDRMEERLDSIQTELRGANVPLREVLPEDPRPQVAARRFPARVVARAEPRLNWPNGE